MYCILFLQVAQKISFIPQSYKSFFKTLSPGVTLSTCDIYVTIPGHGHGHGHGWLVRGLVPMSGHAESVRGGSFRVGA